MTDLWGHSIVRHFGKVLLNRIDIFIGFYRVISNRKKNLIAKTFTVRDLNSEELIKVQIKPNGFKTIEIEPKMDLHESIDRAVLGCQSKPRETYLSINKMITLHNMALQQADLADGFVNLWSLLEVACKEINKASKIEAVIFGILPILQNGFFSKYFFALCDDLKNALPKKDYDQFLSKVKEKDDDVSKLMYLVLMDKYEKDLENLFNKLSTYPNIRQKIYKLNSLKDNKKSYFAISEKYARRLKWHLYRLYRVRNEIVHAGHSNKYIQTLGEHLHIYCDDVLIEIITKLAISKNLTSINDVLLDTRLLLDTKMEQFNSTEGINEADLELLSCITLF